MTRADALSCEACGLGFDEVQPVLVHQSSWKGRAVAIATGLLVAAAMQYLRS